MDFSKILRAQGKKLVCALLALAFSAPFASAMDLPVPANYRFTYLPRYFAANCQKTTCSTTAQDQLRVGSIVRTLADENFDLLCSAEGTPSLSFVRPGNFIRDAEERDLDAFFDGNKQAKMVVAELTSLDVPIVLIASDVFQEEASSEPQIRGALRTTPSACRKSDLGIRTEMIRARAFGKMALSIRPGTLVPSGFSTSILTLKKLVEADYDIEIAKLSDARYSVEVRARGFKLFAVRLGTFQHVLRERTDKRLRE